jgi:hypothetical protein
MQTSEYSISRLVTDLRRVVSVATVEGDVLSNVGTIAAALATLS